MKNLQYNNTILLYLPGVRSNFLLQYECVDAAHGEGAS